VLVDEFQVDYNKYIFSYMWVTTDKKISCKWVKAEKNGSNSIKEGCGDRSRLTEI
jgi:hypothetical protein